MSRSFRPTTAGSRALLIAAVCGAACREARIDEGDLDRAVAAWRARQVTSYDIEVAVSGRFERRVELAVRDGAIVRATVTEHGMVHELNEAQASPYTVEGLLQIIAGELRDGRGFVRVWFDEELAYPEHIELGPRREGERVLMLKVERFEPASPSG